MYEPSKLHLSSASHKYHCDTESDLLSLEVKEQFGYVCSLWLLFYFPMYHEHLVQCVIC